MTVDSQVDKLDVVAYKSLRKPDAYLIVPASHDLEQLPEALIAQFGEPQKVVEFELHEERYMAQADAKQVLHACLTQGFYLQLPKEEVGK